MVLLLHRSHRVRPDAPRGADGAKATKGVLDLGRREVVAAEVAEEGRVAPSNNGRLGPTVVLSISQICRRR